MHLDLKLSKEQKTKLSELATQFQQELEDPKTLPFPKSATLSALKEALKTALEDLEPFRQAREAARTKATLLCLSHKETAIRNLPWQTATEDLELLTIAKTPNSELTPHQASVGFPLKVLVMVSSPEKVTRLNYEDEELLLLRAFSPLMAQGLVQVHFTDDGSLVDLRAKLTENKYHILHYSGHGEYHKGKGVLALEDPLTGAPDMVTAEAFNKVLAKVGQKGHRPDLVVLSACKTAQGVAVGDLSGVADTLLDGGIPAVIAMSASILDDCATHFAENLYAKLSEGFPLNDAFQEARVAVKAFEIKHHNPAQYGLAPGQWLIPQLLLNEEVGNLIDPNSKRETLDLKTDVDIIRGERALVELRVRPENYVFVGRRREKRTALRQLRAGASILLRGQGGVGKTALAEHLAIRLMAGNPKIKVFTFSEKTPAAQSLLDQLENYLNKEKEDFEITSQLVLQEKQVDKLFLLLGRVSKHCRPVFLFDNIELFQNFNKEKGIWVWQLDKHDDVRQLVEIIHTRTSYPLIITGRYPIAEFPDLAICNMNTVPFGDFFRKCHQLNFSGLTKKAIGGAMSSPPTKKTEDGKPLTFEGIARLLHKTFGGNYRALEFFDELYVKKKDEIFGTLKQLSDFEDQVNSNEIKDGVLAEMSEDLILKELLGYLDEKGRDTLLVLAQFNIPVLPMAIGMQRAEEDRSDFLEQAVSLTLAERQEATDGVVRFYVTPLVRDWLYEEEPSFDAKLAGDYHDYVVMENLSVDALGEHHEAFEWYFKAQAVAEINKVGGNLNNHYYKSQQFRLSLAFGLKTEAIAGNNTEAIIYSNLGTIFQIFGQLDRGLTYLEKALAYYKREGNRKGEGILINNISQIYDAKGDYITALQYLEQSLKIRQEIGDRQGEGATLNNLATTAYAKGDYNTALQYFEQSLKIRQEIGDRRGESTTLNNISQIHSAKGDYNTTLQYLEQSLKIRQEIGDRQGEGATLNNISQIHKVKGDYNTALQYLEQSLKIRQEIGDLNGMAITLSNMGALLFEQEKMEEAIPYFSHAYRIFEQIESPSKDSPAGYLGAIIEKIGEARFQEIIQQLNQDSQ